MSHGRFGAILLVLALQIYSYASAADKPLLRIVDNLADAGGYDAVGYVIVDTRPLSSCKQSSLQQAKCLPVEDVLAPHGRLANWSGILWLLGSAGLTGEEHVLVVGQQADRRSFIAGLLVLAGQSQVTVVRQAVTDVIDAREQVFAGSVRATTRTSVYTAPMRSDLVVLRNELRQLVGDNAIILDGRNEAEYYGISIPAARGGHIPGAVHSPLTDWRRSPEKNAAIYATGNSIANTAVAYAHDTFDSLVYFTAMLAAGVTPKIYLAGWVDWAADGALNADSVSYPRMAITHTPASAAAEKSNAAGLYNVTITWLISAGMIVLCLLGAGFYTGRKYPASGKA